MLKNPAPTPARALARSDRAILRQIAHAAQALTRAQAELARVDASGDIAHWAHRVSERASALETLRQVAIGTGCARRSGYLVSEAFDGLTTNLYP